MPDPRSSRYPVYAIRTLGGFYLVTRRDWGKVCELRESLVPADLRLEPLVLPVEEVRGTDFRQLNRTVMKPVLPDDLVPGLHRYRLHRRGFGDWLTTSPIAAVYAGAFTEQLLPGAEYLVIARDQAWLVDAAGDHGYRLLANGWDGAAVPVDAAELLTALPDAIIIQVKEAKLPEMTFDEFADHTPGWASMREKLREELAGFGVSVRAVLFESKVLGLPELLLAGLRTDDTGAPDPRAVDAVERYDRACYRVCQRCGATGGAVAVGVRVIRVPAPYLLDHHQLCQVCRAQALTDAADAMTPAGGFTPLLTPGEQVTVWRSATGLHLAAPNGYADIARVAGQWWVPRLPMPRWLDLPEQYAEARSQSGDAGGRSSTREVEVPADTLPGMRIAVTLSDGGSTEFTAYDVFHGTATTSIDDEHTFLIYQAGVTEYDRVWLFEYGEASRLLADGWDARPDLEFELHWLLAGSRGEVGVIRLDRIRRGASGGRAGFDAFAPGWVPHLNAFLAQIRGDEFPPRLSHADVSPVSGEPIIRLSDVTVWGRWANERQLRQHARKFRALCLRSCAICGEPGRLTTLRSSERYGSVRRCLCLTHENEEIQRWTD